VGKLQSRKRQFHFSADAPTSACFEYDLAAQAVQVRIRDRQTQSPTLGLGGKKRLTEPRPFRFIQTGAFVIDLYLQSFAIGLHAHRNARGAILKTRIGGIIEQAD
jgi:hypothetical protein